MPDASRIVLDGDGLDPADVVRVARRSAWVDLDPDALERATRAHELAAEMVTTRAVYGRTTGVGANRHAVVDSGAADDHGLRLLRSHAGGVGEPLDEPAVRAMLVIRLNQLAAAGSGVHPRLLEALQTVLRVGALPVVHARGAIGTGDLTAMAEIGLTLAGERPWSAGRLDPVPISPGDALAFLSSNAATLALAVLAWSDLDRLLRAGHVVAALSYCALAGSPEAYAERVHARRPHAGTVRAAAEMRRLLRHEGELSPGARIQDPYGLRAFPQVHGPALDATDALERVLRVDLNAATENPLVDVDSAEIYHHGQFSTAHLALALDHARAALHHVAELSTARLGDLVEPDLTGLAPFLAAGPSGSSGVMILEYVAHDALAQLRHVASPVTLGTAVISRGLEDHASFSTQAARSTAAAVTAYRTVLACELIAAVRALRLADTAPTGAALGRAFAHVGAHLPHVEADHPTTDETARAQTLVDGLAAF